MSISSVWPFRPEPAVGEILSCYLARIAYAHGIGPRRFYSHFLPGVPLWSRDIDRSASRQLQNELAAYGATGLENISNMTLQDFELVFARPSPGRRGICPWINAIGSASDNRRRTGMQYCSECLREDPTFKRIWRLSFVTVCLKHQVQLSDCCAYCSAPVLFHRTDSFDLACYVCGHRYTRSGTPDAADETIEECVGLQQMFFHVISEGRVELGGQTVDAATFFAGASFLLRFIKPAVRSHVAPPDATNMPTGQIELLRTGDRAKQCVTLRRLLTAWPAQFLEFATDRKIRVSDAEKRQAPVWMRPAVEALPVKQLRARKAATAPIRLKLRALHRNKAPHWRTKRATLLLSAAGDRR